MPSLNWFPVFRSFHAALGDLMSVLSAATAVRALRSYTSIQEGSVDWFCDLLQAGYYPRRKSRLFNK